MSKIKTWQERAAVFSSVEKGCHSGESLATAKAKDEEIAELRAAVVAYENRAKLEWSDYVAISDAPEVHEAILALIDSGSEDNAAGLIAAVIGQFINRGGRDV